MEQNFLNQLKHQPMSTQTLNMKIFLTAAFAIISISTSAQYLKLDSNYYKRTDSAAWVGLGKVSLVTENHSQLLQVEDCKWISVRDTVMVEYAIVAGKDGIVRKINYPKMVRSYQKKECPNQQIQLYPTRKEEAYYLNGRKVDLIMYEMNERLMIPAK